MPAHSHWTALGAGPLGGRGEAETRAHACRNWETRWRRAVRWDCAWANACGAPLMILLLLLLRAESRPRCYAGWLAGCTWRAGLTHRLFGGYARVVSHAVDALRGGGMLMGGMEGWIGLILRSGCLITAEDCAEWLSRLRAPRSESRQQLQLLLLVFRLWSWAESIDWYATMGERAWSKVRCGKRRETVTEGGTESARREEAVSV